MRSAFGLIMEPYASHLAHSNELFFRMSVLTHWGRVTHICVGNLTITGSDNGLSPGRRQAITWTNVGILLIGPIGTNFSEMLIEIHFHSTQSIWKCRLRNGVHLSRPQWVKPPPPYAPGQWHYRTYGKRSTLNGISVRTDQRKIGSGHLKK